MKNKLQMGVAKEDHEEAVFEREQHMQKPVPSGSRWEAMRQNVEGDGSEKQTVVRLFRIFAGCKESLARKMESHGRQE